MWWSEATAKTTWKDAGVALPACIAGSLPWAALRAACGLADGEGGQDAAEVPEALGQGRPREAEPGAPPARRRADDLGQAEQGHGKIWTWRPIRRSTTPTRLG